MTSIRTARQSYVLIVVSLFLLIALIGIGCYVYKKQSAEIHCLTNRKNDIETSIAALEASVKNHEHYPAYKKKFAHHLSKLTAYNDSATKKFISTIIADVAHEVPPALFLSDLTIKRDIIIGGFAHNIQSILDLLNNLSHLPYICNGKIVKLKTAAYQNSLLEFLIKLEIKPCKETNG